MDLNKFPVTELLVTDMAIKKSFSPAVALNNFEEGEVLVLHLKTC